MMNADKITEHMPVVGSDGEHLGTVDHVDGQRIKLTKSDPMSGGVHHYINLDMVQSVDTAVRLSLPAAQARMEWVSEGV
ncbi:MAG: DUF2171 domain-containing protein [Hyphomicrobiales bacterium]|nr:DUF2171 domain-containing protein [Hyphomicrobiales bacterium]